jgi:hypothetical protein
VPLPVGRLVVGHAEDRAEVEADRMADDALGRLSRLASGAPGAGDPTLDQHRHGPGCDHVRRSGGISPGDAVVGHEGGPLDAGTSTQIESRRGSGRRLEEPVRQRMEQAFSTDLSGVRIHDDPTAARLNRMVSARAFTTGRDVFFGAGEYAPDTAAGERVLAHEIAHTLQPSGSVHRYTNGERKGMLQGHYQKRAEEYEFKLGYALSRDPRAIEGAKSLTDKFRELLIERQGEGKESEAYQPKKTNHGRVSKERITEVFESGNLRERMGTLYAAITNYDDKLLGLGNLLQTTANDVDHPSALIDSAKITQEMSAPKARMFGRRGRQGDPSQNDRVTKTEEQMNKHLETFFTGKDAPTPNRVIARGEAPLSSREYEGAFPKEAKQVASSTPGWVGLDEEQKAQAYRKVLGDKVLATWKGGETWFTTGPKLQEESANKNMRMLTGFSGTTDMYFHAAEYFKLGKPDLEKIRLAALGSMIPARDHTFHEIMTASTAYGLDYADGPAGYAAFAPLKSADLRALTGVEIFPHELISAEGEEEFDDQTEVDGAEKVPTVPKKSELPGVGWRAKYSVGLSTYEAVLKAVDDYHKALAAKKKTRFALADAIVKRVDTWMDKNAGRGHGRDDAKHAALSDLRDRAHRAGTNWAVYATEAGLIEKARARAVQEAARQKTATAKAAVEQLTSTDDDAFGVFGLQPEVVQGMGEDTVIAFAAIVDRCQALGSKPVSRTPSALPAVADSPELAQLLSSPEGMALVADLGANGALLLRYLVGGFGATRVCQPLPEKDVKDYQLLVSALGLIGANFGGVKIRLDGVGPREGDVHKVDGGGADKRAEALAAAYRLTPLELDCIIGYTTLEYKAFVAETAAPERQAALDSGLRKLPSYSGPLFRGDYAYTNSPKSYRIGKRTKKGLTSTAKSLADSFVPKRPTAHVFVSHRSGGDIEALSKKTWEREVLFPRNVEFELVSIVDKRHKKGAAPDATLSGDGGLTGKHGMPTMDEQRTGGSDTRVDLKIDDPHVTEPQWTEYYTKNFSNKVWLFWKEV